MILANGFVDKVAINKTKENELEATVKLIIPLKGGRIPDFRVVMSGPVEVTIQAIQLDIFDKPALDASEPDGQTKGKEEEIPE